MNHRKEINKLFSDPDNGIDILYVCVGFSGLKMAGDKNFYIDLFEKLSEKGLKIAVVSVDDPIENRIKINTTVQPYPIFEIRRPFHYTKPETYWLITDKFTSYRHQHSSLLKEHFERFITIFYWRRTINRIIKKGNPKIIHFLDPFLFPMIKKSKKSVFFTQPKSEKRWGSIYEWYMRFLMRPVKKCIIFNPEQKQYFPPESQKKDPFIVQSWGCKANDDKPVDHEIREKYMHNPKNKLFLWSGFLQQIVAKDFEFASALAKKAIEKFDNVEFVFAFKPEIPIDLPKSEAKIKYVKPGADFRKLMASTDFFFSPVVNRETIIAPPLTWIEATSFKKPIMTTFSQGINSYYENKKSIIQFDTEEAFFDILDAIKNNKIDLENIGEEAFKTFLNNFEISKIVETYNQLYTNEISK